MGSQRTYTGITRAVFETIQRQSATEHSTSYVPAAADKGQATTDTVVGTVVLTFDFEAGASTLTYGIAKKPFVVTESEIWAGIDATVAASRS
jgi:hypothetical protein